MGNAAFAINDYEEAENALRESIKLQKQIGQRRELADTWLQLSKVYLAQGKETESIEATREAGQYQS